MSKHLSTKVTSKVDSRMSKGVGSQVLAPPMTSVTVERHQPVNKVSKALKMTMHQFGFNTIQDWSSTSRGLQKS
jgi:hypothetical protein